MAVEAARGRRPTSRDVAARAGVSRATVSQVLNGRGERFPDETRARVLSAAEELRYRPSPAGRALVTGRSDVLVLYMPNTTFGGNLQDLVEAVDATARRSGLTVVVRFAGRDSAATFAAIVDLAPAAVVDLAALAPVERVALEEAGVAVLPRVSGDNEREDQFDVEIGRRVGEHLLSGGPRTLVYAALADARADPFGPRRLEGLRIAARLHGIAAPLAIAVPLEQDGAVAALEPVLGSGDPVAVGCYNDAVAVAVVSAARRLGRAVPGEVSVMGVDATQLGQLMSPRLTTLKIDLGAVVARIVHDVHELLGEPQPAPAQGVTPLIDVVLGETT